MSSSSWVCFECRLSVRRPTQHEGDVPCAQCGTACWPLGYKIPIPPRRDVRAWRELHVDVMAKRHLRAESDAESRVRQRHDLEQEVRRLEAMDSNPGRATAILQLKKQIEDL